MEEKYVKNSEYCLIFLYFSGYGWTALNKISEYKPGIINHKLFIHRHHRPQKTFQNRSRIHINSRSDSVWISRFVFTRLHSKNDFSKRRLSCRIIYGDAARFNVKQPGGAYRKHERIRRDESQTFHSLQLKSYGSSMRRK